MKQFHGEAGRVLSIFTQHQEQPMREFIYRLDTSQSTILWMFRPTTHERKKLAS